MEYYKIISFFALTFILVNNINSLKSDINKPAHKSRHEQMSNSELFINKVKKMLELNSVKGNDALDYGHVNRQRQEIQLSRMNLLRKSLRAQFEAGGVGYNYQLDPDTKKNLTQLISSQEYPVERYVVKTQDGFLLDLHRIPRGRKTNPSNRAADQQTTTTTTRPAIFLQHGFISSACDWVMNFGNDSLGFILADHGYDVWMGNSRGNVYSRKHVTLKPEDELFWDWSFHEMGVYDTPAFIDFILNKTGQTSLYYVGHSQGTTIAFVLLSQKPEYQKKIRFFVGLAPIMSIAHIQSPIKHLSAISDDLIYDILGGNRDFLPHNNVVEALVDAYCDTNLTEWLCNDVLFLITGPDISNLNTSRVEVYLDHTPAGSSVKDLVHFTQMYRRGRFAMYDFGSPSRNMKHYGNATPPAYDVTKVVVPALLFSGTNDWLADPKDVAILNSTLPNLKATYSIQKWNHLDFVWGLDAAARCYDAVLKWLPRF